MDLTLPFYWSQWQNSQLIQWIESDSAVFDYSAFFLFSCLLLVLGKYLPFLWSILFLLVVASYCPLGFLLDCIANLLLRKINMLVRMLSIFFKARLSLQKLCWVPVVNLSRSKRELRFSGSKLLPGLSQTMAETLLAVNLLLSFQSVSTYQSYLFPPTLCSLKHNVR